MYEKKRGQIWVETVIYTLIALILIGLVLTFITPKIKEIQFNKYKKQITISSDIHYTEVLTYTTIPELTKNKNSIILYNLVGDERINTL